MKPTRPDRDTPHSLTPSPQAERGKEGEVRWQTPPHLWEQLKLLACEMRHKSTPGVLCFAKDEINNNLDYVLENIATTAKERLIDLGTSCLETRQANKPIKYGGRRR